MDLHYIDREETEKKQTDGQRTLQKNIFTIPRKFAVSQILTSYQL